MAEVHLSKQLRGAIKLWRYLSLDKLVDLRSSGQLFFAPLSSFIRSDPFEGFLPASAMGALGGLYRRGVDDLENSIEQLDDYCERSRYAVPDDAREMLQLKLQDLKATPKRFFHAIAQCQTVNCWHANDVESEAMWRLYSDNGKAVAIETTVDALRESIASREAQHVVHVYPVKYLDFFDKALTSDDCVVDGRHTTPLLKRLSYRHENEVRAFIGRVPSNPREAAKIEYWQPAPIRLPVDVTVLLKRVHVSPYAVEPFGGSVQTICKSLGLHPGIVESSRLLRGQEELLKRLEC